MFRFDSIGLKGRTVQTGAITCIAIWVSIDLTRSTPAPIPPLSPMLDGLGGQLWRRASNP